MTKREKELLREYCKSLFLIKHIESGDYYGLYDFWYTKDFDSHSDNMYYVKLYYKEELKYNALVKITPSYLQKLLTK